jgi:hypothetical protein
MEIESQICEVKVSFDLRKFKKIARNGLEIQEIA